VTVAASNLVGCRREIISSHELIMRKLIFPFDFGFLSTHWSDRDFLASHASIRR